MSNREYFAAYSSMGHIAGNIMYVMQKYYMSYFPKNTFKYIHKATKSMSNEFKLQDLNSITKKKNPVLAIFPKIMIGEEHEMLGADRMQRPMPYDKENTFLSKIIQDYGANVRIDCAMRRLRMQFDMNSVWSSRLVQLNQVWQLKNSAPENRPTMIRSRIKFPLPKHFILTFALDSGFKLDENNMVIELPAFMEHLNRCSKFPITYELKTSTGNNEFFCVYKTDFIITFGAVDNDDGEDVEQTKKNFKISHGLQVDVTIPSIFYYVSKDEKFNVDELAVDPQYPDNMVSSEGAEYGWLPMVDSSTNWNIQSKSGYEFNDIEKDHEKIQTETESFKALLSSDIMNAYNKAKSNGIDHKTYMRLIYFKDRAEASELDYTVDYDNLEMTLKGLPYKSHVLGLYVDMNYVHSMNAVDDGIYNFTE